MLKTVLAAWICRVKPRQRSRPQWSVAALLHGGKDRGYRTDICNYTDSNYTDNKWHVGPENQTTTCKQASTCFEMCVSKLRMDNNQTGMTHWLPEMNCPNSNMILSSTFICCRRLSRSLVRKSLKGLIFSSYALLYRPSTSPASGSTTASQYGQSRPGIALVQSECTQIN